MSKDAWEKMCVLETKIEDLIEKYKRTWEMRSDLDVIADGCGRHVLLNGSQHNVSTIRELIVVLNDACDFVENVNPQWAGLDAQWSRIALADHDDRHDRIADNAMTWNYRVRKQSLTSNGDDFEDVYDIIEVYYDHDDNVDMWSDAVGPSGNTLDELRDDLHMMVAALNSPVLDAAELPGYAIWRRQQDDEHAT